MSVEKRIAESLQWSELFWANQPNPKPVTDSQTILGISKVVMRPIEEFADHLDSCSRRFRLKGDHEEAARLSAMAKAARRVDRWLVYNQSNARGPTLCSTNKRDQ